MSLSNDAGDKNENGKKAIGLLMGVCFTYHAFKMQHFSLTDSTQFFKFDCGWNKSGESKFGSPSYQINLILV